MQMTKPNLWVYKNNSNGTHYRGYGGDWNLFFDAAQNGETIAWGDTAHMAGTDSRKMAFLVEQGDLVLCWQSNEKAAIGLASVETGPDDIRVDNDEPRRVIYLKAVERFESPVPLAAMKKTNKKLAKVKALQGGLVSSLYPTSPSEAKTLFEACATKTRGRGRSTPEHRRAVEKAAINAVTEKYEGEGWKIVSVKADNVGYDLLAKHKKNRRELHLEVKGISGDLPIFMLTANERNSARKDSRFRLCAVTAATDKDRRRIHEWTGRNLEQKADFKPVSYRVSVV